MINKILTLKTPTGNSEVIIRKDGLASVHDWVKEHHEGARSIIVTDEILSKVYGEKLKKAFPEAEVLIVPPGEQGKNLKTAEEIAGKMLDSGIGRKDVLIGFGGGVITDLAGFVASIYMRGIAYIAIPTSLLGMVDAAIGGKTGVDTAAKNILGTFYPAELVLIDASFLEKLPEKQLKIGMAEVIKYAATLDSSLAEELERDKPDMDVVLKKSVRAKVTIVQKDLREGGIRKVLNFGHTFGHAAEQLSGYRLSHGEAISIGMVLANKVAQKLGKQSEETGRRIKALLEKYDLPTALPEEMTVGKLTGLMRKDKKMSGNKISFIIAPEMGKYEIIDMSPEELVELAK